MSYYEDVQFELGAAQAAFAMDDVYAAALHTRKAEAAFNNGSFPQEVYAACVSRGVVVDDDFIRLDMSGRASFAPIAAEPQEHAEQCSSFNGSACDCWTLALPGFVDCPVHGLRAPSSDGAHCAKCAMLSDHDCDDCGPHCPLWHTDACKHGCP